MSAVPTRELLAGLLQQSFAPVPPPTIVDHSAHGFAGGPATIHNVNLSTGQILIVGISLSAGAEPQCTLDGDNLSLVDETTDGVATFRQTTMSILAARDYVNVDLVITPNNPSSMAVVLLRL